MKDFYHILGTPGDASPGEIDEAYRKLAAKFQTHAGVPDHFLENYFQEITEAHQILSDPVKRVRYDAELKKAMQKRISHFKTKHINIAAALMLISCAFLFGWYVLRSVRGTKPTPIAKTEITPAVKTWHRKKHHTGKVVAVNQPLRIAKTQIKPPPAKADSISLNPIKPAPVMVSQAATNPPTLSDVLYVRANQTGVVHLHQLANYASDVIAAIPNHAQVHLIEKGQDFYKVSFKTQTGYLPKWTVTEP